MKFVDCQAFAGGLTLGVQQSGWELLAKREEEAGFALPVWLPNFPIEDVQASTPAEWRPVYADAIFGNPPCSGFSLASPAAFRGPDSSINACMWNLVRYAAKCQPVVVAFESVQGAWKHGRDLMTALWRELESESGHTWYLTHVLHDAAAMGAAQRRKRYLWVATRFKPRVDLVPATRPERTAWDAIGDLECTELGWHSTPDGHVEIDSPSTRRLKELVNAVDWQPGEYINHVLERWADRELPAEFEKRRADKADDGRGPGYIRGYSGHFRPRRLPMDRPAFVLEGRSMEDVLHPTKPRMMTMREGYRLMGFPDTWRLGDLETRPMQQTRRYYGKGVCVEVGKWLGDWMAAELTTTNYANELPAAPDSWAREYLLQIR